MLPVGPGDDVVIQTRDGLRIGSIRVKEVDQLLVSGEVSWSAVPSEVVEALDNYAEVVNNQMFSFLDEAEAKVAQLGLTFVKSSGDHLHVHDLQVFDDKVSFRIVPI